MAPSTKHTYKLNDRILCDSAGLFYEAKIIEVTDTSFKVHYQGWHKRYDELVLFDNADVKFKVFTEEALLEAKRAVTEAKKPKKGGKKKNGDEEIRRSEPGSRASTPSVSGSVKANSIVSEKPQSSKARKSSKRKEEKSATSTPVDSVRDPAAKDEKYIELTVGLKQILVDDHDLINRQEKLCKLPSEHTVESIVREYSASLNDVIDDTNELFVEYDNEKCLKTNVSKFVTSSQGVMDYLDSLLSYHLLYKFERVQYVDLFEKQLKSEEPSSKRRKTGDAPSEASAEDPTKKPSSVYGLPHLLRLLCRFDGYLESSKCNQRMTKELGNALSDFVVFLSKNKDKYFDIKKDYESATLEYKKQAML